MVDELTAVLDTMAGVGPAALADGKSVVELHRCLARLEAIAARATAAFDAGGEWAADGARSAAAWVSVSCGALLWHNSGHEYGIPAEGQGQVLGLR